MMTKGWLGRRGAVVAGIVLTGGLVAGGATAYAAGSDTAPAVAHQAQAKARAGHAHKHRRLFRRGIHGEVTVKDHKTGRFVTREWQRGLITAISGDHVTVKSADGVRWTWTVENNTKITRDGKKVTESVLKDGDTVLVVGARDGGANDAKRVFAPSAAQLAKAKAKAARHGADS